MTMNLWTGRLHARKVSRWRSQSDAGIDWNLQIQCDDDDVDDGNDDDDDDYDDDEGSDDQDVAL